MPPAPAVPTRPPPVARGHHGPFSWSSETEGLGSVRLRLRGELDLAGAAELRAALLVAEDVVGVLAVDLSGLEFIDCAALACLFRVAGQLASGHRRLVLVGDHGQVGRLLDLTGTPPETERWRNGPGLGLGLPIEPPAATAVV